MKKYFTQDHEWIAIDGDTATVGITDYAQDQLGDVVFVELPEVDDEVAQGDEACVIESVKAAGEVHSPVSGKVVEVNSQLEDEPGLINRAAESDGWVYKMTVTDPSELDELMDAAAYQDFLA